jgi:hypothetical protein
VACVPRAAARRVQLLCVMLVVAVDAQLQVSGTIRITRLAVGDGAAIIRGGAVAAAAAAPIVAAHHCAVLLLLVVRVCSLWGVWQHICDFCAHHLVG